MGSVYSLGGGGGGSGTTSDASGTAVIGTAVSPVTLAAGAGAFTVQSGLTDVTAYKQCTWYVIIVSRDAVTPTTQINVRIDWTADGGSVFSTQGTESISSGASTLSLYEAQYSVTGLTGPFSLPPISLPVVAPEVRVRVGADAGSTTAYVLVARQA
jgi:hypothetical protein